jgi:hypothetical protein
MLARSMRDCSSLTQKATEYESGCTKGAPGNVGGRPRANPRYVGRILLNRDVYRGSGARIAGNVRTCDCGRASAGKCCHVIVEAGNVAA